VATGIDSISERSNQMNWQRLQMSKTGRSPSVGIGTSIIARRQAGQVRAAIFVLRNAVRQSSFNGCRSTNCRSNEIFAASPQHFGHVQTLPYFRFTRLNSVLQLGQRNIAVGSIWNFAATPSKRAKGSLPYG
jgi:hypothetical protein